MAQETVNMNVAEDCLKMLKAGLEKSNKSGNLSLEEAFYMHLALKNLSLHVTKCKEHVCQKVINVFPNSEDVEVPPLEDCESKK